MHCRGFLNRLSPRDSNSVAILYVAGENRFNSHRLAASAANASGSLQTALSKLPDHAMSETARFCVSGSQDRVLSFIRIDPKALLFCMRFKLFSLGCDLNADCAVGKDHPNWNPKCQEANKGSNRGGNDEIPEYLATSCVQLIPPLQRFEGSTVSHFRAI